MAPNRYAINEYQQVKAESEAAFADPHTLVSMLFNGIQEQLAVTKGSIERKDVAQKGRSIGRAMDMISYLQSCLNLEQGGEIAASLDALYDYMIQRLLEANIKNDAGIVEEISRLIRTIQGSWDGIREQATLRPTAPPVMASIALST